MIEGKKQYSISYLAKTEADKVIVLNSLNEVGALNIAEGRVTELKLAYPIKKQTSALFGSIVFEAIPDTVSKIDERLKFAEGILRFLIVAIPSKKPNIWLVSSQRNRENINNKNVTDDVDSIRNEEVAILKETETSITEQTDNLSLTQNPTDNVFPVEERFAAENKIDDASFDEKLEEILADSKLK